MISNINRLGSFCRRGSRNLGNVPGVGKEVLEKILVPSKRILEDYETIDMAMITLDHLGAKRGNISKGVIDFRGFNKISPIRHYWQKGQVEMEKSTLRLMIAGDNYNQVPGKNETLKEVPGSQILNGVKFEVKGYFNGVWHVGFYPRYAMQ